MQHTATTWCGKVRNVDACTEKIGNKLSWLNVAVRVHKRARLNVSFGRLRRSFPWEFWAELFAGYAVALLGGDRFDVRRHFRRRLLGTVQPRPDMTLANGFASALSQDSRESGLAVDDLNCPFEGCDCRWLASFRLHASDLTTLVVK